MLTSYSKNMHAEQEVLIISNRMLSPTRIESIVIFTFKPLHHTLLFTLPTSISLFPTRRTSDVMYTSRSYTKNIGYSIPFVRQQNIVTASRICVHANLQIEKRGSKSRTNIGTDR
jgi:hypothetical protein